MKYWIIKLNPANFNIDQYLVGKEQIGLRIGQRALDISKGDKVFIWRAKGNSKNDDAAGIIAFGEAHEVVSLEDIYKKYSEIDPNKSNFYKQGKSGGHYEETEKAEKIKGVVLNLDFKYNQRPPAVAILSKPFLQTDADLNARLGIIRALRYLFDDSEIDGSAYNKLFQLWQVKSLPFRTPAKQNDASNVKLDDISDSEVVVNVNTVNDIDENISPDNLSNTLTSLDYQYSFLAGIFGTSNVQALREQIKNFKHNKISSNPIKPQSDFSKKRKRKSEQLNFNVRKLSFADSTFNMPGIVIAHTVKDDGDCGYTAFGILRSDALDLLIKNLMQVRDLLIPVVKEQLLQPNFLKYMQQKNVASKGLELAAKNYLEATGADSNPAILQLQKFADDLTILQAYLYYDVRDKKVDLGWAHPCVLQALADIQKINLRLWVLDANGNLQKHSLYPEYTPTTGASLPEAKNLLFINNNHFEYLEFLTDEEYLERYPHLLENYFSEETEDEEDNSLLETLSNGIVIENKPKNELPLQQRVERGRCGEAVAYFDLEDRFKQRAVKDKSGATDFNDADDGFSVTYKKRKTGQVTKLQLLWPNKNQTLFRDEKKPDGTVEKIANDAGTSYDFEVKKTIENVAKQQQRFYEVKTTHYQHAKTKLTKNEWEKLRNAKQRNYDYRFLRVNNVGKKNMGITEIKDAEEFVKNNIKNFKVDC